MQHFRLLVIEGLILDAKYFGVSHVSSIEIMFTAMKLSLIPEIRWSWVRRWNHKQTSLFISGCGREEERKSPQSICRVHDCHEYKILHSGRTNTPRYVTEHIKSNIYIH